MDTARAEFLASPRCNGGLRLIQAANVASSNSTDPAYVSRVVAGLAPRIEALRAANLSHRSYVYGFDESHADHAPAIRLLFGAIKARWPEVRTLSVTSWVMPDDLPVDIWVYEYQFADLHPSFASAAARRQAAGGEVWAYHCVSPAGSGFYDYLNSFVDRSPLEPRLLLGWLPTLRGLTGWLYWVSNFGWQASQNVGSEVVRLDALGRSSFNVTLYYGTKGWPRQDNGDGLLVYPGPMHTGDGARLDPFVRVGSRSVSPPWRPSRFRLALCTYAPWGVRVVSQTKSRKIPTRKILPLFFVIRSARSGSRRCATAWRTPRCSGCTAGPPARGRQPCAPWCR